jgi:hypothetical protein
MQAWYNGRENGAELDQIFDDADALVRSDYEENAPAPWDLPDPDFDDEEEEDEEKYDL